ncbi:hypothetical protein [Crocosphaera sp. XPORK-15E]|uniref:hypothetical protein n=1 Tax=Crocosphaera sp. XPORK-15E TaxID=3110247 RepID=UPI002B1FD0AF|nr:hypothetical protein [Crocosphaera sp. XPORK-15E]MEA5532562.1 hypothetical protein [Crocosphaera sp. XPORK-15E]
MNQEDAPSRIIKFNQCDVLVFPERNVGLQLIEQRKLDDDSYKITVEVENITELEATFAHFSVIHYVGVTIDNDYGFILLKPRQKERITYSVISSISSRTIDLPFFVALYLPTQLNGFKSLELINERRQYYQS